MHLKITERTCQLPIVFIDLAVESFVARTKTSVLKMSTFCYVVP